MFFSPPFSCSASLCEQLLAGGSGETPAYSFWEYCCIATSFYWRRLGLEDCRIITSFYYRKLKTASYQRFLLFVVVEKSQQTRLFFRLLLFFVDEF